MEILFKVVLIITLLVIAVRDYKNRIIEHGWNIGLFILAIINFFLTPGIIPRLLAGICILIGFMVINEVSKKVRRMYVIGGADLFLMANLGLLFGLTALRIIFLASCLGVLIHIAATVIKKEINFQIKHPFGLYLAIIAIIVIVRSIS